MDAAGERVVAHLYPAVDDADDHALAGEGVAAPKGRHVHHAARHVHQHSKGPGGDDPADRRVLGQGVEAGQRHDPGPHRAAAAVQLDAEVTQVVEVGVRSGGVEEDHDAGRLGRGLRADQCHRAAVDGQPGAPGLREVVGDGGQRRAQLLVAHADDPLRRKFGHCANVTQLADWDWFGEPSPGCGGRTG